LRNSQPNRTPSNPATSNVEKTSVTSFQSTGLTSTPSPVSQASDASFVDLMLRTYGMPRKGLEHTAWLLVASTS
jgi:hypothetical protein